MREELAARRYMSYIFFELLEAAMFCDCFEFLWQYFWLIVYDAPYVHTISKRQV
jgi:hypothetical protein